MLRSPQYRNKKLLGTAVLVIIVSLLVISILASILTLLFIRQKNVSAAAVSAKLSLPLAHAVSFITQNSNATIQTWESGLALTADLPSLLQAVQPTSEENERTVQKLTDFFSRHQTDLHQLLSNAPHSPFVLKVVDQPLLKFMDYLSPQLPVIAKYLDKISTGKHTWLVLFQNSEELRATGGFLGSYALVTLQDGKLTEIVIEDVYDADGQFTGYLPAPAGVNEYLSSNNGLRLPDANWFVDFPTSAQTITQFFAFSNRHSIDGVVAVNLETVQEIVKLVEPLWLPDYQTHATSDNLSSVLREKRGEFFPGSQDKKQLLTHVWSQLKIALSNLDTSQQQLVATTILEQFEKKNIQLYSIDPTVQTVLQQSGLTGSVTTTPRYFLDDTAVCVDTTYPRCPTDYVYLVESNVGINKANRSIARALTLNLEEYRSTVTLVLSNHNQPPTAQELANKKSPGADHNAYINYQRVIIPEDYSVRSIAVDSTAIDTFDERTFVSSSGQTFREVGFLVIIKEQETNTIVIEFSHSLKSPDKERVLTIQKQPGVIPYSVTVNIDKTRKQFLLEKDTTIEL